MTTLRNLAIVLSLFAALAFSARARADGIMSGPCIGCGEGIINVGAGTTCPTTPIVSSLSTTSGTTAGGTPVTISGSNFTAATAVTFGGTPAASFSVTNSTTISATSPTASPGTVDVRVTQCATSPINQPGDQYTFIVPPTYTGPGDVVAGASVWYGLRAYNVAYATGGNSAGIVCLASSFTTCQTINILTTGAFDAASASSFCTTQCAVKSLTDQTGGGHPVVCASATVCPQLTFNCVGSLPCITFVSGNTGLATAGLVTLGTTFSYEAVAERTGNFTGVQGIGGSAGNATNFVFWNVANEVGLCATCFTATASDSTLHAFTTATTGTAASFISVDNTITTGTNTCAGCTTTQIAFGNTNGFAMTAGVITEFGVWGGLTFTNPTQAAAMCHNQRLYWSTPGSC